MSRRVLLLSPSAAPGGAERALLGVARGLPEVGYLPTVAFLENGPVVEWFDDVGLEPVVIPTGRTRYALRPAVAVGRLAAIVRRRQLDLVLSNQTKGHVYGGTAARLAGVPAVFWQHGVPDGSLLDRLASRVRAAAVICGSEASIDAQRRLTPTWRIRKVPPGAAIEDVAARAGSGCAVRRALGWDESPIVGIVGRLQPWKGQRIFLEAAARVATRCPTARFAVVGGAVLGWEGDYPAELERLAARLDLSGRVHFAGHQDDVYPWYDALDVVVHASIGEPFGLVLVEAMALGRALVASASGGPLEIVEDGVSGVLVPPGDAERMADAIIGLLDDPRRRAELGRAARLRAETFSEERMVAGVASVLGEVMEPATHLA